MTLRVEISIVPHGNEDEKRVIRTLNISNLGKTYSPNFPDTTNLYLYGVEVDKYKTDSYDFEIKHFREDGAEVLVNAAIDFAILSKVFV